MSKKLKLPKLKRMSLDKPDRPKILLLSDDLRMHSGIATMSKEFVIGTADIFDWVQLGAALKHPDHSKIFDISPDINMEAGIPNSSVKIYAHTGYGNQQVLRELLELEKPDAILHFTDPRFWGWLYQMEHELRCDYKIPIMYYNIWDAPPAPFWNKPFYMSCDLIMNISKQTNNLVKLVLGRENYHDIQKGDGEGHIDLAYVPHGINSSKYYPMTVESDDYEEFNKFKEEFKKAHDVDFVFFWNNRNIRRKMPADLIMAFRKFCDNLPRSKSKRVGLFMHTALRDNNGTDLVEVVRTICPNYKVILNEEILTTKILNFLYNIADVTCNIASNEGWGLSSTESLMAGTPVINNTTGGLQDQMRFEDENGNWIEFEENFTSNHAGTYKKHGKWAKAVFPSNRSIQGSTITPYIFDDRCSFDDVAEAMRYWYDMDPTQRTVAGMAGRDWVTSEEAGMSATEMSNRMANAIQNCLKNWKPKDRFSFEKIQTEERKNVGIVW